MSDQFSQLSVRLTITNTEPTDPNDPFAQSQVVDTLSHVEKIFFGRSPSNDVSLPASSVSGKHACIMRQNGDFFICDLQSRNGTFLNTVQLVPNEQKPLRSGDKIRISPYEIAFHCGIDALSVSSTENTAMLQENLIKSVLGGLMGHEETPPKLVLVSGYHQQLFLELAGINAEFKVGRSPNCDMVVQDENISREHAILRRSPKGVFIRDNNSRNGIIINGNRAARNAEFRIKDRDEILMGTIKFRFEDPEGAQFEEKVGEVVHEEEPPAASAAIPSPSIPKPKTPPPEPFAPPQPAGETPPAPTEPPPGMPDVPSPTEGADKADKGDGTPAEGEGEDAERENAGPPPATGLTGGQKAVIFLLIALFLIGVALLIFLPSS